MDVDADTLRTAVRLARLMGISDIADAATAYWAEHLPGSAPVTRQHINRLHRVYGELPEPAAETSLGPLWLGADVDAYVPTMRRGRGGAPRPGRRGDERSRDFGVDAVDTI